MAVNVSHLFPSQRKEQGLMWEHLGGTLIHKATGWNGRDLFRYIYLGDAWHFPPFSSGTELMAWDWVMEEFRDKKAGVIYIPFLESLALPSTVTHLKQRTECLPQSPTRGKWEKIWLSSHIIFIFHLNYHHQKYRNHYLYNDERPISISHINFIL